MSIPKSVRDLLGERWRSDPVFEWVFERRRTDPSCYLIPVGKQADTDMDSFSHDEAAALIADNVFGHFGRTHENGVVINEHAQHALTDFLGEASAAWIKYQERLRRISEAGNRPV